MTSPVRDRVSELLDEVRGHNPFANDIVKGPQDSDVDVTLIHAAAFSRLVAAARGAAAHNHGAGVVLWGAAGTGKSHLLARLWRWAEEQGQAHFVWMSHPEAGPDGLARYVLRCTLSTLTLGQAGEFHGTPLYQLMDRAVSEGLRLEGVAGTPTVKQIEAGFRRLVDRLARETAARPGLLDRGACAVLLRFYLSARAAHEAGGDDDLARIALPLLSGDSIDPEEAQRLGLVPPGRRGDGPVRLGDDGAVVRILFALTQLARFGGRPVILCLDNIDTLEADQIGSLTRFLHGLLDRCGNLVVLLANVRATILRFVQDRTIQESSWQRLCQDRIELAGLSRAECRQILEARLERFFLPFGDVSGLPETRVYESLFPLGTPWFHERIPDVQDLTPRRVLRWAKERWEQQQALLPAAPNPRWLAAWGAAGRAVVLPPPTVEELIARKLEEHRAVLRSRPHTLPPSADNCAGLVHALLEQCKAPAPESTLTKVERVNAVGSGKPPCHLVLTHGPGSGHPAERTAVLFLATASALATTHALRRLELAHADTPFDRLLLVTERRQPLRFGASPTAEGRLAFTRLEKLGERFQHLELSFEQYAELDALQGVVVLARSDELEVDAADGGVHAVTADEVIASHHRHQRYLDHVLLRRLLVAGPPPAGFARPTSAAPAQALQRAGR